MLHDVAKSVMYVGDRRCDLTTTLNTCQSVITRLESLPVHTSQTRKVLTDLQADQVDMQGEPSLTRDQGVEKFYGHARAVPATTAELTHWEDLGGVAVGAGIKDVTVDGLTLSCPSLGSYLSAPTKDLLVELFQIDVECARERVRDLYAELVGAIKAVQDTLEQARTNPRPDPEFIRTLRHRERALTVALELSKTSADAEPIHKILEVVLQGTFEVPRPPAVLQATKVQEAQPEVLTPQSWWRRLWHMLMDDDETRSEHPRRTLAIDEAQKALALTAGSDAPGDAPGRSAWEERAERLQASSLTWSKHLPDTITKEKLQDVTKKLTDLLLGDLNGLDEVTSIALVRLTDEQLVTVVEDWLHRPGTTPEVQAESLMLLHEHLDLIHGEVQRLSKYLGERSLAPRRAYSNYLRSSFGVSELTIN